MRSGPVRATSGVDEDIRFSYFGNYYLEEVEPDSGSYILRRIYAGREMSRPIGRVEIHPSGHCDWTPLKVGALPSPSTLRRLAAPLRRKR